MTELESTGKPEFSVEDDLYRFVWPCGVEAELEGISEHRDELKAVVTIRSNRQPRPGLLHSANVNLMSTRTRSELVKSLEKREPDLDWSGAVEAMCFLARERYREGDPAIDLRGYVPSPRGRWLVEPYVEYGGPTILFADGETGKSFFGLALAVTIASGTSVVGKLHGDPGPVLYLDWETSAEVAFKRLAAIAAGAQLPVRSIREGIHYRSMSATLAESASTIRRQISDLGAKFVLVDSLGYAKTDEPETANASMQLFKAARTFQAPWAGIDHVTKSLGNDSTKPFGSVYTPNSARLTWSMDKVQEEGETISYVSLINRKNNNGPRLPRRGYRVEFENDEHDEPRVIRYTSADLASQAPALATLKERILAELKPGPLSIPDLTERIAAKSEAETRARVSDLRKKGQVIDWPGSDKEKRVGLAYRGVS